MATSILSTSGTIIKMYSKSEQEKTWKEIEKDLSVIGKRIALETPRDKKKYYIVSEREIHFETYESIIEANGKIIKIKHTICNQQEKTYKAVRKAYEL